MPVNECIPVYEPGTRITCNTTAAVRGKRFVAVSTEMTGGPFGTEDINVTEAGAGVAALGVSCYDVAINEKVPVLRGDSVVPVTAGAAVAVGSRVTADAEGRAIAYAAGASIAADPVVLGIAVEAAAAAGEDLVIALTL